MGNRAEAQFQRQVEAMMKKIKTAERHIAKKKGGFDEIEAQTQALREALAKKETYIQRIHKETAKLDAIEAGLFSKIFL